jgi:hypothetical protein
MCNDHMLTGVIPNRLHTILHIIRSMERVYNIPDIDELLSRAESVFI